MFLQELGDDFVLLRELGLQGGDLAVLAVLARPPFARRLKGRGAVLKEQLLPAVKLRGENFVFVAQIGDGDFVDQMSFDDRDFVCRCKL